MREGEVRVIDLFSGIGGFSLGLERAGMRTVSFCEIDPFCRAVLAKHWPSVPCHDDITTREFIEGEADVICGGFPCQDISTAGKGAGMAGERSGLWRELLRAIRVVRPKYAIVENVAALLGRGLSTVLGDLAEIKYDAEWHCIPASAIGAPHRRDRIWIVAYPEGKRCGETRADCERSQEWLAGRSHALADANAPRLSIRIKSALGEETGDTKSERQSGLRWQRWPTEPDVGRVAHGVPARVYRLRSLGNSVVPQIPEVIGRVIVTHEAAVANL